MMITNCKNCGAPLHETKCEYCGTEYYKRREDKQRIAMYQGENISSTDITALPLDDYRWMMTFEV